jgi:transposase-like protein
MSRTFSQKTNQSLMSRNRYSKEDQERALELHRRKWGYRRIAQVFGCAETTVKKWVENAGQEKNPGPAHDNKVRRNAVNWYKRKNVSIAEVAKRYGVHPKTLSRWLADEGIEGRRRPTKFSRDAIMHDIESGLSGASIARKHKCSQSYVSALRNGKI